jgi:hypothetical protein
VEAPPPRFEAEWAKYDKLGGYNGITGLTTAATCWVRICSPRCRVPGQWEVLGKFGKARFREGLTLLDLDHDQKTTEVDVNYVLKQFNARVMMFYLDTRFDAVRTNFKKIRRRPAAADVSGGRVHSVFSRRVSN